MKRNIRIVIIELMLSCMLISCMGKNEKVENKIGINIDEVDKVIVFCSGYDANHKVDKCSTNKDEFKAVLEYIDNSRCEEAETSNVRIGGGRNVYIKWNDGEYTKLHIENDNMVVNSCKYYYMDINVSSMLLMTDSWEDYSSNEDFNNVALKEIY